MSKSSHGLLKVNGTAAPKFTSVRNLFERNMNTAAEKNAQLCVYIGQEKVIDLWTSGPDQDFGPDTLVNIFSSGKSLESIAIAALFGQGLIQYDQPIATYWPEFSQNGKADLTVAQLMRHEAGLVAFDVSIKPQDLLRQSIKDNRVGEIIERQTPRYPSGVAGQREYHAVTRGWIVNELFRRLDPSNRTIGEYVSQALNGPLQADAVIGVEQPQLDSVNPVFPLNVGFHLRQTCRPAFLGRPVQHNFFQLAGNLVGILPNFRRGTARSAPSPIKGLTLDLFNDPSLVMGETPSANTHASARGMAKIAATLANGGQWQGVEILSPSAWQALHANPKDAAMGFKTTFTQGGIAKFSTPTNGSSRLERALNQGREGFYGWMGLGGSIFQWHPEKQIGFSFVPTSLHVLDLVNERAKTYQKEVLNCLDATH